MTNEWDDAADYLGEERPEPVWMRSLLTADAAALAGFALAAISLFVVGAGNAIVSSSEFGPDGSTKILAVIPGVQAFVALVALALSRFAIRLGAEAPWGHAVARAGVLVGAVSLAVNLAATGFALT